MPSVVFRVWAFASVVFLLSGCGSNSVGTNSGGGSGGSSTTVTVSFTGATPAAVGTQIGSGSYVAATPANTITLTLPSGVANFAVAYVCTETFPPSGAAPSVEFFQNVVEASVTDGTNLVEACQSATTTSPTFGALTGSVDGSAISGVTDYGISQGGGFTGVNLGYSGRGFSVSDPVGPQRVLVTAYNAISSPPAQVGSISLLAARNFDNQPVPGALNNGNTVVLGPADEATSQTITYNSIPSGFASSAGAGYGTEAELVMGKLWGVILAFPATTQYPVLPAGATESGDYYLINTSAGNGVETMIINRTSTSGVPVVFTFPPAWGYSGPSPAALPTFNVDYAGFSGSSSLNYQMGFYWDAGGARTFFYIAASGNYLNGTRSITFPDLTGLPGFSKPTTGAYVDWNAAISQTVSGSTPSSPANATTTTVSEAGIYVVP